MYLKLKVKQIEKKPNLQDKIFLKQEVTGKFKMSAQEITAGDYFPKKKSTLVMFFMEIILSFSEKTTTI